MRTRVEHNDYGFRPLESACAYRDVVGINFCDHDRGRSSTYEFGIICVDTRATRDGNHEALFVLPFGVLAFQGLPWGERGCCKYLGMGRLRTVVRNLRRPGGADVAHGSVIVLQSLFEKLNKKNFALPIKPTLDVPRGLMTYVSVSWWVIPRFLVVFSKLIGYSVTFG